MDVIVKTSITNKCITIKVDPNDTLCSLASEFKAKLNLKASTPVVFLQEGNWIQEGKTTFLEIKQNFDEKEKVTIEIAHKDTFFQYKENLSIHQSKPNVTKTIFSIPIKKQQKLNKELNPLDKVNEKNEAHKEIFISHQDADKSTLSEKEKYFKNSELRTIHFIKGIVNKDQNIEHTKSVVPFVYY